MSGIYWGKTINKPFQFTTRPIKPALPSGCRWLGKGEVIRVGDIGFDGGFHIINLGYIVGQKWNSKSWMPIARKRNASNAPRQPRRDSGVGLDAVVGRSCGTCRNLVSVEHGVGNPGAVRCQIKREAARGEAACEEWENKREAIHGSDGG